MKTDNIFAAFTPAPKPRERGNEYAMLQPYDRLVRKEVALGEVKEIVQPEDHIGLQLFPFQNVDSDDVIFDYVKGLTTGMAPAIAEGAQSELAQKDQGLSNQGRASIIDWRLKDHYDAADVQRFRELQVIAESLGPYGLPSTLQGGARDFPARLARDTEERRRRIDNRLEWLIMQSLSNGTLGYNDGNIKFGVDWKRPSDQQAIPADFSGTNFDPIGLFNGIKRKVFNRTGVILNRCISSNRALMSFMNSDKFIARTGFLPNQIGQEQMPYLLNGYGPQYAIDMISQQTGIQFIEYDSGYRSKPDFAAGPVTFNRFLPENRLIFLPDENQIREYDSNPLGFGKMLTSPHTMGNMQPGYYEWEQYQEDPWGQNIGTGIKAFPVFPHMELSVTVDLTLPPEL